MPSFASRLTTFLLRAFRVRQMLHRQSITPPPRKAGEGRPPAAYARRYQLTETRFADRPVYTLAPRAGATSPLRLLYWHGGGYQFNANPPNWSLVARLVDALGCTVTAPDYPLAPEHRAPAALDFTRAFYDHLLTTDGVDPANLVLVGDSAGGGLALALCQQLVAEGRTQPRRLVLLWPWLDLTLADPLTHSLAPQDALLTLGGVQAMARRYAGAAFSLTDPRLSPLFGPLRGLPPMSVFVGGRDMLLADSRRLRDQAARLGTPLAYHEYPDVMHGWLLLPFLPESRQALAELVAELTAAEVPA